MIKELLPIQIITKITCCTLTISFLWRDSSFVDLSLVGPAKDTLPVTTNANFAVTQYESEIKGNKQKGL